MIVTVSLLRLQRSSVPSTLRPHSTLHPPSTQSDADCRSLALSCVQLVLWLDLIPGCQHATGATTSRFVPVSMGLVAVVVVGRVHRDAGPLDPAGQDHRTSNERESERASERASKSLMQRAMHAHVLTLAFIPLSSSTKARRRSRSMASASRRWRRCVKSTRTS